MSEDQEPMTPNQELYARTMFQTRILESDGQRYEDLFVDVMTRRYTRFRPVKPQGRIGDQGNDGFIDEEGRYYQVYAPEDPNAKVDTAATKAQDDFAKLKKNWETDSPIKHYHFVFNDKYKGSYPTVEHALAELKRKSRLKTAQPFLAKDLERTFMELRRSEMEAVLRSVVPRPEEIADIDYAALTQVLQHLVDNQAPITEDGALVAPDYDEKIQFNDIRDAASLLRVGNFQNAAVERYFDQHGEFTKRDIRDRLSNSYNEARDAASEQPVAGTCAGDQTFFRLLDKVAPKASKAVQDAAIVLVAYFFEKCDVFEDPS